MEYVNCDFCGGDDFEEVIRQADVLHKTTTECFCIVRCRQCGLHFLNPRPEVSEIGKYYSDEYSFHAEQTGLKLTVISFLTWLANSPFCVLANLVPMLGRRLIPYIRPEIEDPVRKYFMEGRILDIGCGSGESAHFWGASGALQAYDRFAEVYGQEVDDDARRILERHGIPAYKRLSDISSDMKFDIIRMNWSLEHVHSPSEYFRFIERGLSEGGKAVIGVPNYGGLLYAFDPSCVEVPVHLFHFRKQDILNYAKKYNLEVVDFMTFSYPQMFVYASGLYKKLAQGFNESMGLSEAVCFQRLLTRFDRAGFGNDMIFVLEKVV